MNLLISRYNIIFNLSYFVHSLSFTDSVLKYSYLENVSIINGNTVVFNFFYKKIISRLYIRLAFENWNSLCLATLIEYFTKREFFKENLKSYSNLLYWT